MEPTKLLDELEFGEQVFAEFGGNQLSLVSTTFDSYTQKQHSPPDVKQVPPYSAVIRSRPGKDRAMGHLSEASDYLLQVKGQRAFISA